MLLGWPFDPERVEQFGSILRVVAGLERSVVVFRGPKESDDPWTVPSGTIDVWWRGKANGPLMLLLAHLLTTNPEWRKRDIRLLRVASAEAAREEMTRHLTELIESSRIRAVAKVVISDDVPEAIQTTSRHAAVAILGFEAPEEGSEVAFFQTMERIAGSLPRVILVDSAGGIELDI